MTRQEALESTDVDMGYFDVQRIINLIYDEMDAKDIMLRDKEMWIRGLEAELKRLKDKCDWRDL